MPVRVGRRVLLRTAAGAALGLPFMPSLLPRTTSAQPVAAPKRFVGILSMSGQFVGDWYPTATPTGYQLRDTMYGGDRSDGTTALHTDVPGTGYKWGRLSDFAATGISRVLTTELNPYLDKMLLLRGLDVMQATSHGYGMLLGNLAGCAGGASFSDRGLGEMPTIDQVLAYSNRFYSSPPRTESIQLATGSTGSISYTDYGMGGAIEQLSAYLEPRDLWSDLFGDFMSPDMPRENPNRSLMNAVHADYARLRDHRRLSTDDRMTLERHMAFLADIERELGTPISPACTRPDEPPELGTGYPWDEVPSIDEFRRAVELLVDISAAAIRCDLTRVVTMTCDMGLTDAGGTMVNSYHNSGDVPGDWHQFAHSATEAAVNREHLVSLNKWVATQVFGRYLQQLDVPEAEGRTFLDNSLVLMGGELSMDHYVVSQPTLMAGSAGGAINTGYYVDYTQMDNDYVNAGLLPWGVLIPGIPYNRLYVTILQAMGLSPADYERGGRAGYGHTEMFDVAYNWPTDAYDMAQIGSPLPGIFAG